MFDAAIASTEADLDPEKRYGHANLRAEKHPALDAQERFHRPQRRAGLAACANKRWLFGRLQQRCRSDGLMTVRASGVGRRCAAVSRNSCRIEAEAILHCGRKQSVGPTVFNLVPGQLMTQTLGNP